MYAIISDGGRQHKVSEGEEVDIDFRDASAGDQIVFDRVLACRTSESDFAVGLPALAGASVSAEVVGPVFGEKLVIQRFRRRKNSKRKTGHRQIFTRVKINKITPG